jgi:hypothetical protein
MLITETERDHSRLPDEESDRQVNDFTRQESQPHGVREPDIFLANGPRGIYGGVALYAPEREHSTLGRNNEIAVLPHSGRSRRRHAGVIGQVDFEGWHAHGRKDLTI